MPENTGHGHGHGLSGASAGGRYLGALGVALGIGVALLALELVVGVLTSSLALISDAGHLFTDVLGTGLALGAILLSRRVRPTMTRTFGLYRAEVLAALANAVLLFGVAVFVTVAAVRRFADPPAVAGLPVLLTAAVGLVGNLVAFAVLRRGAGESLNVRGAYLEVLADLVGSAGVLVSGLVTLVTGWRYADPIVAVAIGLWVLPRTVALARRALRILFQHAPDRVDVGSMQAELGRLPGVAEVHDLHVWTLTSGMEVVSAHLSVTPAATPAGVLETAQALLTERYQIEHATLQIETVDSARHCRQMSW